MDLNFEDSSELPDITANLYAPYHKTIKVGGSNGVKIFLHKRIRVHLRQFYFKNFNLEFLPEVVVYILLIHCRDFLRYDTPCYKTKIVCTDCKSKKSLLEFIRAKEDPFVIDDECLSCSNYKGGVVYNNEYELILCEVCTKYKKHMDFLNNNLTLNRHCFRCRSTYRRDFYPNKRKKNRADRLRQYIADCN